MRTFLYIALFLFAINLQVNGRVLFSIDEFFDGPESPLVFAVPDHPVSDVDSYWWTPFNYSTGLGEDRRLPLPYDPYYPDFASYQFFDVDYAIGGQRDLVIGFEQSAFQGTSATLSIVNEAANIGFSLGYIGGAYFQWDGDDTGPLNDIDRGIFLHEFPGVGSFTTPRPGISFPTNGDGRSMDFTTGSRAYGITIQTAADHPVFYYIDVLDVNGVLNIFEFTAEETPDDVSIRHWIAFNDPNWSTDTYGPGGVFDWTRVVAFQVRVWTFDSSEGIPQQSVAIDTVFNFLDVIGYFIPGTVENDCDCNAIGESPVSGAVMNLFAGTNTNVAPLTTTTSDATGYFEFTRISPSQPLQPSTTYTICVADLQRGRCAGDSGCRTTTTVPLPPAQVSQNNNIDPIELRFFFTAPEGLVAPPDTTVECGACTTVQCLGAATAIECDGNDQTVNTATDTQTNGCPFVITRTFSDPSSGRTATQRITVRDTVNPVINPQAQNQAIQCPNGTPTIQTWLSTNGGAQATDCSSFTFSNNWNQQVPTCGSVSVTFTARDACGNTATTTASYTIDDTISPTITTQAQPQTVECNRNNSDFNALTAWLANNGGAAASDNCGTTTFSNNYVQGTLQRGCSASTSVIFTASDPCGNVATTSSTFTIRDTTAPTVTTQAQNASGDCGGSGTSFTTWLNNNGNAVATDACAASVTWSNNNNSGGPGGCSESRPVTFTAADGCGNTVSTTASFTLADNSPPTITTQPSPLTVQCSAPDAQQQLNNWLNTQGGAQATDSCTGVNWTNNFNSNAGSCNSVPVTFTACDDCAAGTTDTTHCRSVTSTYTIQDSAAPTFNPAPQSETTECNSGAQDRFSAWLASNANAAATDNCSAPSQITITNDWPVGTLPSLGCNVVSTVTFRARDVCGNQNTGATATYTIRDSTPPTITNAAAPQSVPCDNQRNSAFTTWLNNRAGATASDACTSVTIAPQAGTPTTPNFSGCSGVTTVTFVATDGCGLTASTTAAFTVTDTTPPTITTQAANQSVQCTGSGSQTNTALNNWIADNGGARATDACSAVTWTNTQPNLSGACDASTQVTFTASDACGLQSRTTATFQQVDTVGPTINPPAQDRTVPCNSQTQAAFASWVNDNGGARATDSCQTDPVSWTAELGDGVVGCDFETVTFIASDSCGLSSRTTATFTSTDNTAPTFNPAAQDLTVECSPSGNSGDFTNFINSHGGAVAVDDCALGQFTWTSSVPASNGGPSQCGSVTVTFTVTDNCNNRASTTATYTVRDSTQPTWTNPPQSTTVECDGNGNTAALNQWVSSNGGGSASDSCSTPSQISYTQTPGAQTGDSCTQTRPYTFTARDNCGNTRTASATFTIRDSTRPVLSTPASDASFECDGNGNQSQVNGWVSSRGGAVANDACQGTVTWTNTFPQQGPLPCSSISVTFTASDACQLTVSTTATLSITDNTDPTFSFFPDDVIVPCDADISEEVLGRAEAFDVCAGELFVSSTETSLDEPPVGNCPGDHVVTRTFSAVDECGNGISDSQTIRVQIVRSSGPCDPEGCECDDCCPPPQASDCLPAPCQASNCRPVPCTATACTCAGGSAARDVREVEGDLIEQLPQCKPVYIYVNDDDDSTQGDENAVVAQQRMLVTSEPLHESAFRNKSGASSLVISFLMLAIVFFLF